MKTNFQIIDRATAGNTGKYFSLRDAYQFIEDSRRLYDNFNYWFFNNYCNNFRVGTRKIIRCFDDKQNTLALALLKDEPCEKKICSIKVDKKYRRNGIGRNLFEYCIEVLDTDKPLITISEERYNEFSHLIEYFDFNLCQVLASYYNHNSTEYVFNGILNNKKIESITEFKIISKIII